MIVDGRDTSNDGIDIVAVTQLLGVSESSVWRAVRDHRLPVPFYIVGRSARWIKREIVEAREAMRMSPRKAARARWEARKKRAEVTATAG